MSKKDATNILPALSPVSSISNLSRIDNLSDTVVKSVDDPESLYTYALVVAEQQFGDNHLFTAQKLNNLALF